MSEPLIQYDFITPQKYKHPDELAGHLGGHENETHVDDGALSYLIEKYDVKSMLDVGCGPGGMVELAIDKGLEVLGVDGDNVVERSDKVKPYIHIHDFAVNEYVPEKTYDLGWSVEFVEHVEKKYMPYFMKTLTSCKYVAMTHALPNQPGHHHVNCMPIEYWVGVFEAFGFMLQVDETNEMRKASTMRERYIRQQGYVFKNGRF
jgi:SAM-dependent methyltransferase